MSTYQVFKVPGLGPVPSLDAGFLIWANNANTVGLRTEWPHNRPPEGVSETVRLSRVEYSVNVFFYRSIEATGAGENDRWRYAEVNGWWYDKTYTIRRKDTFDYGTPAAKSALVRKVIEPFTAWLNTDEGAALTAVAETDDREAVLACIERKLELCSEVERTLLLIKAAIVNGRRLSATQKAFARYGDIQTITEYERSKNR